MRFGTLAALSMAVGLLGSAQADIFTPSVQKQIELGKEAAKQTRAKEKVLYSSDPRVQELRRLGNKLVALIPEDEKKKQPFEYTFDVIDSKELNAFAYPGGPIFFYTGLLDKMKTEDEVVGILSHELTHIRHQHWAKQYAGSLRRNLGLIALLTIIRANDDWFRVANMYDSLTSLQYSRGDELDADGTGFELMVQAGYNPQGMVNVFQILLDASKSKPPEFVSTHPDTQNRINKIKQRMTEYRTRFPEMIPRKTVKSTVAWSKGWPILVEKEQTGSEPIALLTSK